MAINANNRLNNYSQQQYNHSYNLVSDTHDDFLVNNSKLITLNRLNNESESALSHNQMDLLTNLNHQSFNYMLQEAANDTNSINNSGNLDTSMRPGQNHDLGQQQYTQNHLNAVDGSLPGGFGQYEQHHQQGHHHNDQHQQQFDYNQDQICLDEANVNEGENTNEEYLIFNLLNKIATCTNTDKLMSSMSDDESLDKVRRNSGKSLLCSLTVPVT